VSGLSGEVSQRARSSRVARRPPVSIDQAFDDDFRRVNTNYFKALGIPFLRGLHGNTS